MFPKNLNDFPINDGELLRADLIDESGFASYASIAGSALSGGRFSGRMDALFYGEDGDNAGAQKNRPKLQARQEIADLPQPWGPNCHLSSTLLSSGKMICFAEVKQLP